MQEEEKQRYIEHWKRCIRELPEELFFSIMRTYLGRLSTPFHKHKLVEQLAAFLSKEETLRRIVAMADTDDASILTAVDLLADGGAGELYHLLRDEYDYFTFHAHLLNLQERLLLYSDPEHGTLHLTPQLASSLREKVFSPALLFPVRSLDGGAHPAAALSSDAPWLREELLWALAAFFRLHPAPFKHDGELRKKRREDFEEVFPALSGEEGEERTALLFAAAKRLRIFRREESRAVVDHNRLQAFAELPRRSRHLFLWAAAAMPADSGIQLLPPAARVISDLLALVTRGELEARHLERLIAVLSYRHRSSMQGLIDPEALRSVGLFGGNGLWYERRPLSVSLTEDEEVRQPLILHSDFTATAAAPFSFTTGLFLADLFELRTFTVYPQLELTKNSFTSCRMQFDDFDSFLSRLAELSSSPLPPNIRSSLETWEKNYSGVTLTRGIVLQIDEGRKHLVEHNEELAEYMLTVLGDGIFLFRDDAPDTLLRLLSDAGIDPLPPLGPGNARRSADSSSASSASPAFPASPASPADAGTSAETAGGASSGTVADSPFPAIREDPPSLTLGRELPELPRDDETPRKELLRRIRSLDTDNGTREALEQLVRKKVIIFPSQIRSDLRSQKPSEARGIDYSGKVRVVEETIHSSWDVLEAVERDPKGAPIRHLLRPEKLQKMGNDLLLYGREFPQMKEVKLRVRKLSYVRRWRNSLVITPKGSADSPDAIG